MIRSAWRTPRHEHSESEAVPLHRISDPVNPVDLRSGQPEFTLVQGELSQLQQSAFSPKDLQGQDAVRGPVDLSGHFIGKLCIKGRKEDFWNQDDFLILLVRGKWRCLAVFDGHGQVGHKVSDFAQRYFTQRLLESSVSSQPPDLFPYLSDLFNSCLDACKAEMSSVGDPDVFECRDSGTTATLAVIQDDVITVAYVGDSRCVLGSETRAGSGKFRAMDLSRDHHAGRKDEARRVIDAGGDIKRLKGDIPLRVFVRGHGHPGLAMTRSIGDTSGEDIGIIADPEIQQFKIDTTKQHVVVVASDGVWEFLPSERVMELVSRFPKWLAQEAAEAVVTEAIQMWKLNCPWSIDDITCIVSYLYESMWRVHTVDNPQHQQRFSGVLVWMGVDISTLYESTTDQIIHCRYCIYAVTVADTHVHWTVVLAQDAVASHELEVAVTVGEF